MAWHVDIALYIRLYTRVPVPVLGPAEAASRICNPDVAPVDALFDQAYSKKQASVSSAEDKEIYFPAILQRTRLSIERSMIYSGVVSAMSVAVEYRGVNVLSSSFWAQTFLTLG